MHDFTFLPDFGMEFYQNWKKNKTHNICQSNIWCQKSYKLLSFWNTSSNSKVGIGMYFQFWIKYTPIYNSVLYNQQSIWKLLNLFKWKQAFFLFTKIYEEISKWTKNLIYLSCRSHSYKQFRVSIGVWPTSAEHIFISGVKSIQFSVCRDNGISNKLVLADVFDS